MNQTSGYGDAAAPSATSSGTTSRAAEGPESRALSTACATCGESPCCDGCSACAYAAPASVPQESAPSGDGVEGRVAAFIRRCGISDEDGTQGVMVGTRCLGLYCSTEDAADASLVQLRAEVESLLRSERAQARREGIEEAAERIVGPYASSESRAIAEWLRALAAKETT